MKPKQIKELEKSLQQKEQAVREQVEKLAREDIKHPMHKFVKAYGSIKNYMDMKMAAQKGVDNLWARREI